VIMQDRRSTTLDYSSATFQLGWKVAGLWSPAGILTVWAPRPPGYLATPATRRCPGQALSGAGSARCTVSGGSVRTRYHPCGQRDHGVPPPGGSRQPVRRDAAVAKDARPTARDLRGRDSSASTQGGAGRVRQSSIGGQANEAGSLHRAGVAAYLAAHGLAGAAVEAASYAEGGPYPVSIALGVRRRRR
jgi:hypothetical protein